MTENNDEIAHDPSTLVGPIIQTLENDWSDNDVTGFYLHSFSLLPIEKSVRLAKMWWRLYNQPKDPNSDGLCEGFGVVVAYMALHLVDPMKRQGYVMDIAPPGIDLDPHPDLAAVLKVVEASDKACQFNADQDTCVSNDDIQQQANNRFLPFESKTESEEEIAAANKWFSTLSPRNQVAFTALLSAICLRTCTKELSVVSKYINESALTDFVKLYRRQPITGVIIPAPSKAFIDAVSLIFRKGTIFLQMVLSRFLTVYKIAKASPTTKPIVGLLERSLLNKTSGNGLKLVTLAIQAAETLQVDSKDLLSVMTNENSSDILKFLDIVSANVLWPWCRVLHPGYHLELRMSQHSISALVFAAILWPNGDEPGWKIRALVEVRNVLPSATEIVEHIRKECQGKKLF